jgi:hypothetical protein
MCPAMYEVKTKEGAIRLLLREMGKMKEGTPLKPLSVSSRDENRVNAILYPDEYSGLLSPGLHEKSVIQTKEATLVRPLIVPASPVLSAPFPLVEAHTKEDSSIGHNVLVSKFDIRDIHVDDTTSGRLGDLSSVQLHVANEPAAGDAHSETFGDLLRKRVTSAVDRMVGVLEALPLEEPTVEELIEHSLVIEASHQRLEAEVKVEQEEEISSTRTIDETPKSEPLDTPSMLVRVVSAVEDNPFMSPGLGKPTSNLIHRFISDSDYWIYLLLVCCNQRRVIPFSTVIQDLTRQELAKIGESTYSEVFLCRDTPPFVIKVIPVRTSLEENQDSFYQEHVYKDGKTVPYASRAMDVFNEVLMTKKLSPSLTMDASPKPNQRRIDSTGFISCCGAYLVQGSYPKLLLDLWQDHDAEIKSENICPKQFSADQHFLVLMLSYGGKDLEKFALKTIQQAFSIVHQLILSIVFAQEVREHVVRIFNALLLRDMNLSIETCMAVMF